MPENDQPGSDTNEAKAKNKHSFRSYALLEFLPIGLRLIFLGGMIALIALAGVSMFAPHMAERIKFFTTNFLSLVVLFVILVQSYISRKQWDAMERQSSAMQDQLVAMRDTLKLNERAVIASEAQAAAAETSAQAARDSVDATTEAFYIAERAYISIQGTKTIRLAAGESPQVELWLVNGGRTPAWEVDPRSTFGLSAELPDIEGVDFSSRPPLIKGGHTILAGDKRLNFVRNSEFVVTEEELKAIHSRTLKLIMVGEVRYKDFRGREQVYRYRGWYDPDINNFIHY